MKIRDMLKKDIINELYEISKKNEKNKPKKDVYKNRKIKNW